MCHLVYFSYILNYQYKNVACVHLLLSIFPSIDLKGLYDNLEIPLNIYIYIISMLFIFIFVLLILLNTSWCKKISFDSFFAPSLLRSSSVLQNLVKSIILLGSQVL